MLMGLQGAGKTTLAGKLANHFRKNVLRIAKEAITKAKSSMNDLVILDTAGRLQIDEELMNELKKIKDNINITESLLVVDSMSGQDAANVAKSFSEKLNIDGIIITKLDADTRGGAALSVKEITRKTN